MASSGTAAAASLQGTNPTLYVAAREEQGAVRLAVRCDLGDASIRARRKGLLVVLGVLE